MYEMSHNKRISTKIIIRELHTDIRQHFGTDIHQHRSDHLKTININI